MTPRPRVILTEGSETEPLNWLRERCEVIEVGSDDPRFHTELAQAEGLIVRTYTRVTETMLSGAPKLRVVGRGGVGIENIDVAACRRRGVEVVFTPDANTLAVGDLVVGYMTRLIRDWEEFSHRGYTTKEFKSVRDRARGRQLNELTLGILGMGRVGRRVGSIASRGFGMRVIYNDLLDVSKQVDFPATSADKEALYRDADILSIHVTMLPGNENLVGRQQLAMMKQSALVINTSRGEVLDAAALADAIRTKRLAGAALDVYWPEPPAEDFPLIGLPNVILTPHVASRTYTAVNNMSWVVRDVVAVLEGRSPQYPAPSRSQASG